MYHIHTSNIYKMSVCVCVCARERERERSVSTSVRLGGRGIGEELVGSLLSTFSMLLALRRVLLDSALRGERMVGLMRRTEGTCTVLILLGGEEGRSCWKTAQEERRGN